MTLGVLASCSTGWDPGKQIKSTCVKVLTLICIPKNDWAGMIRVSDGVRGEMEMDSALQDPVQRPAHPFLGSRKESLFDTAYIMNEG